MKVIRAEAMGICFGVRDALSRVDRITNPNLVTIHGELVHNESVLVQLETRGFQMSSEQHRAIPATPAVLITAHGISDIERTRLHNAGKQMIDTTCPLVRRVHDAAKSLANNGFHVVIIGKHGHVEVMGIAEDLANFEIVSSSADVRRYSHDRLGIVCQSTTPPHCAEAICDEIRLKNPHAAIRFVNTICQPTRDRQRAIEDLIQQVEAMVVVGGRNSNNTRALVDRCRKEHLPVVHVQGATDIDASWFHPFQTVGLTAGTSTLESTIDELCETLAQL